MGACVACVRACMCVCVCVCVGHFEEGSGLLVSWTLLQNDSRRDRRLGLAERMRRWVHWFTPASTWACHRHVVTALQVSAWKESVCRPLLDHELGVFRGQSSVNSGLSSLP